VTAGRTLHQHLRDAGEAGARAASDLATVLEALAGAGARMAGEIARAPFEGGLGETGETNAHGDRVRRLDVRANDLFLAALQSSDVVATVASEELPVPVTWPRATQACLAVCLDPLDGSLNTDVAGVLGTIFGIRPVRVSEGPDPVQAMLGAGTGQVAAGYLVYGPATVFVYAAAGRVHAFVLDPADGQFRLTHTDVRVPTAGRTYAVNDANWPRWGPGPRALIERLRTARTPSGPYSLRYSGALVADFHRTLVEGGIYVYPAEAGRPDGRIRLLYEAAPLAFVAEAGGGRASTGRGRILDVVAADHHQRTPLYIGSGEEVGWAEQCLRDARE
jgi:fructose-1,6-bisphosphatase I